VPCCRVPSRSRSETVYRRQPRSTNASTGGPSGGFGSACSSALPPQAGTKRTADRRHACEGTSLSGGRKREEWTQPIERSRGGRTSKIHCLADDRGSPIAFALTPGNKASGTGARGPAGTSPASSADKGPRPGDTWHLDAVCLRINGVLHHLWRAVDRTGWCSTSTCSPSTPWPPSLGCRGIRRPPTGITAGDGREARRSRWRVRRGPPSSDRNSTA
jgi:hypothetical protein